MTAVALKQVSHHAGKEAGMSELKLSSAIRLGAMLKPQAFYDIYDGVGTCAIGAACDAMGQLDWVRELGDAVTLFPVLRVVAGHPFYDQSSWSVCTVVANLNDLHRWTREQIAEWVATVEAQQVEQPAAERTAPCAC
jgi:hypothetical protein